MEINLKDTKCLRKLLNDSGILFKENFKCCNSCAIESIEKYKKKRHIGYAFFHKQDAEWASDTGNLYISFGYFRQNHKEEDEEDNDYENEIISIGKIICEIVKDQGFIFEWDENPDTAILLKNLNKNYYGA